MELTTARLALRPVAAADLDDLIALHKDEVVAKSFGAMIGPANAAAIAVAERLGMTALREDTLLGTEVIVFALRREAQAASAP